ncbi:hypothetical protein K2173_003574 [Erythroxylum novogranatense]|uniref:Prolamin-like domain-containing protein n=1 Tax=Erythroxylum novogranatense TaxID=1862640 RepID=A0AAV8TAF2_9ROSI|nr:hypothetical protein K2173_003574 [Erythroxylum novogranatense]
MEDMEKSEHEIMNIMRLTLLQQNWFRILYREHEILRFFPGAPLPEPRPGYFKFLDACIQGTNITCVKEIFETIFEDGTTSDDCCLALILIGKTCHDEFVKYIANGPSFKSRLSEYIAKSDQLYGRCAGIVDPTLAR